MVQDEGRMKTIDVQVGNAKMSKPAIQILSKTRIHDYGTTQMRCIQPAAYLRAGGWSCVVGCLYRTVPSALKAVVFHRASADPQTLAYFDYANSCGLVTIYDTDDLLFDEAAYKHLATCGGANGENGSHVAESVESYRTAMQRADVVLVSTDFLADRAREFHDDVRMVRNGLSREFMLSADRVLAARRTQQKQQITIGYLSGSAHHDTDFEMVREDLVRILEEFENIKLLLVGKLTEPVGLRKFGERFEIRSFIPYSEFVNIFCEVDINIVPLRVDDDFEQARSELKYIEAGACGIPTIASPTRTYARAIRHDQTGLLTEHGEWYCALRELVVDPSRCKRLGERARHDVVSQYGPARREEEWDALIRDILRQYEPHKVTAGYWERQRRYASVRYACAKRWAYIGWRKVRSLLK